MAALAPAPFADDQLTPIRRLLDGASMEQVHWLQGYLAGWNAAKSPPATAQAAPPAARAGLTILYGTESGNAEALAGAARKVAQRLGFAARTLDMADATPELVAASENLLVIASTWGEGDPPQRAEAFHAALMAAAAPRFEAVRYAVLALGDRAYARFCETGRAFDERLAALGGKRVAERLDCDLEYEAPAKAWIDSSLHALEPADSPAIPGGIHPGVIHVDFARAEPETSFTRARPFEAVVTERANLNSSRSTAETVHVELSLEGSGLAYEPGDSLGFLPANDPALVKELLSAAGLDGDAALHEQLRERLDVTTLTSGQVGAYARLTNDPELLAIAADGERLSAFMRDRQVIDLLAAAPGRLSAEQLTGLLRPLPPRYYSVASSRALVGEEAHLLIGAVRWHSHGRARRGVASIDVAERRAAGERLRVFVKPNPHFRLPADADRPIIMIGPGTGVAPFRAFMQQREATGARAPSWLFFGARNFTHDFLYQLEWQDWLKSGVLSRLDVAFSRDQREKIYVQHRMWEARSALFRWLADGAVLYVCGNATAMAKDVHATLLRIGADQSGGDGTTWLRGLQQEGRYLRDVY